MRRILFVALALSLVALSAFAAPKKNKQGDQVWTNPDFASLNVESIAMLPVTSFDHSLQNEKQLEAAWAQTFSAQSGYRWTSGTTSRNLLRDDKAGDSLLTAARNAVLKLGRIDSLGAGELCRRLRTRALLTVRIDLWDRQHLEPEQAGKPSTNVELHAALVDSAGRLLWTAAGSELGEGLYHDALVGLPGDRGTNAALQSGAGAADGPLPIDVAMHILQRWQPQFPARVVPAAKP